jgi:2-polyprenyl-3-methyl-5-hydroxy-6-metoxy-1,4-benzoquinol methylase
MSSINFCTPEEFYSEEIFYKYSDSPNYIYIQEKLTDPALEFLDLKISSLILDIGSGAGISSSLISTQGHAVVGLAIVPKFLHYSVQNLSNDSRIQYILNKVFTLFLLEMALFRPLLELIFFDRCL